MNHTASPSLRTTPIARGLTPAFAALIVTSLPCVSPAAAQESTFNLTIHDSKFEPSTLQIPAGKKIKISIRNARTKPAEFESHDLNREKVIPPGTTATIYVGPLSAGTYGFFDDFNQSVRGQIVAK